MDGSLQMSTDSRCLTLERLLQPVAEFQVARQIIRDWATMFRLQPCTTIVTEKQLIISYHDEEHAEVNYGCRQHYIPLTTSQQMSFCKEYLAARDGW
ncbi:MAG: hypothetical protein RLZZ360_292 [Candidatus Parcubacteria bacterium]